MAKPPIPKLGYYKGNKIKFTDEEKQQFLTPKSSGTKIVKSYRRKRY